MITEKDLQEAIAYCNGKTDPKRDDAILLAACYILQDHMLDSEGKNNNDVFPSYSYAQGLENIPEYSRETVGDYGKSIFLQAVAGQEPSKMWEIMDELMDTLKMVNERVYNGVMRKIQG